MSKFITRLGVETEGYTAAGKEKVIRESTHFRKFISSDSKWRKRDHINFS